MIELLIFEMLVLIALCLLLIYMKRKKRMEIEQHYKNIDELKETLFILGGTIRRHDRIRKTTEFLSHDFNENILSEVNLLNNTVKSINSKIQNVI